MSLRFSTRGWTPSWPPASPAGHRSYRSTRYVLAQLDAAFGTLPLTDLSAFRIEGWKAARRKVVAPATVNRELTVLKAILAKAVAWHLLDVRFET
jgi:hypothetical protein